MWHVLSFTVIFDEYFFKDVEDPPTQEGDRSAGQKENTKNAALAQARLRQAESYARRRAEGRWLSKKQIALLQPCDDGTLLEKANEATLLSGHGCLRRPGDGAKLLIGESIDGCARIILENWEPPDPGAFLKDDPAEDLDENLVD